VNETLRHIEKGKFVEFTAAHLFNVRISPNPNH